MPHPLHVAPLGLPGAADQPGVQHDEVEELAEAEGAVGALARPGLGLPDRHPLEVGLHGGRAPHEPVAFLFLDLVVLGAVGVGVVRDLVVVPDAHEGMEAVDLLQVGVRLVLGVPGPVVGERGGLLVRTRRAIEPGPVPVAAVGVLVEVVAEVQHRVQVVPLGDPPVDVEVAERQVGAGDEGEPDVVGTPGQGPRPAHRRLLAERLEAVVVGRPRLQSGRRDLEGVVAPGSGGALALGDDFPHPRVPRHLPADRDPVVGRARDPRPEQHPVGQRVAARHPVGEDRFLSEDGQGAGERQDESRPGGGSEKEPAVHGHGATTLLCARPYESDQVTNRWKRFRRSLEESAEFRGCLLPEG